jgi:hypothetical protein
MKSTKLRFHSQNKETLIIYQKHREREGKGRQREKLFSEAQRQSEKCVHKIPFHSPPSHFSKIA